MGRTDVKIKTAFMIKLKELIGSVVEIDGEQIKITDYCKSCRKAWGEDDHHSYYLKLDLNKGVKKVISKKLKPLL